MSLRAFAKGFATTAAPSFLRGFEQQGSRIESRRQDERQDKRLKEGYEREDKIRTEDLQREDRKTAVEDAKATLLGAANTGDAEAVTKAFDGMPLEMQDALRLSRGRYVYTANRKKKQLSDEAEVRTAQLEASRAQTEAANLRRERDTFGLAQEQGVKSGQAQVNLGTLTDENGAAAASSFFYETIADGVTPNNTMTLRPIAEMLDAYHGSSEFVDKVQQGLIQNGDDLVFDDVMNNVEKYSPEVMYQMALSVSSTSPNIAKRIRRLAAGRNEGFIEQAAENVLTTTYASSLGMGKSTEEAMTLAEEAANRLRMEGTRRAGNNRLVQVGKRVSSAMESRDIKTIMKRVREEIKMMPDLNPTQRQLKELEMLISQRLNLDPMADAAGSGSAGPLGGMQGPASQALPDIGKLTESPNNSSFANEGSPWEKNDIGGKLMGAGKFASLGPLGPAAYGISNIADATGLSVDVGFND